MPEASNVVQRILVRARPCGKALLSDLGARIIASRLEELATHMRAGINRWGRGIREAAIKAEGG